MTYAEFVAAQIAAISRAPVVRALNELQDGFCVADHQAIDAPRMSPPVSWGDAIDMRHAMVIPGRGGDHANK